MIKKSNYSPRITEVNSGNHIGNLNILAWFEDARSFITNLFQSNEESIKKTNSVIVNIDANFIAEVHYGENVQVNSGIVQLGKKSCSIYQEAKQQGVLVASIKVTLVNFDMLQRQSILISKELREQLSAWQIDTPD
jgi:acyl-CoA thioester hydrolase|tara:strand:+ start:7220 stop:7627 length:408 start_codon:yes stop_codon:yes gene_type:complete